MRNRGTALVEMALGTFLGMALIGETMAFWGSASRWRAKLESHLRDQKEARLARMLLLDRWSRSTREKVRDREIELTGPEGTDWLRTGEGRIRCSLGAPAAEIPIASRITTSETTTGERGGYRVEWSWKSGRELTTLTAEFPPPSP